MSAIQSIARRCLRQALANKDGLKMAADDSIRAISNTTISKRTFATSYLDKGDVTDRVLSVVKNFDKVDQSKVWLSLSLYNVYMILYMVYYDHTDYTISCIPERSGIGQSGHCRVGHGN